MTDCFSATQNGRQHFRDDRKRKERELERFWRKWAPVLTTGPITEWTQIQGPIIGQRPKRKIWGERWNEIEFVSSSIRRTRGSCFFSSNVISLKIYLTFVSEFHFHSNLTRQFLGNGNDESIPPPNLPSSVFRIRSRI